MKFDLEQTKYILETLSNTPSQDIDGDEFEVEWGSDDGVEGFASHSISDTAGIALEHINSLEIIKCDLMSALEALLADMRLRAQLRGDVGSDGCVILDCGNGVLMKVDAAITKAKAAHHE